jgi:hypothetical protein
VRREERDVATGSGRKADPWVLRTAPGAAEDTVYRDDAAEPPAIVCQVGSIQLKYDNRMRAKG